MCCRLLAVIVECYMPDSQSYVPDSQSYAPDRMLMRPLTKCKYIGLLYYTSEYNIMEPQRTTWKKNPFSVVESMEPVSESNETFREVDLPTVALDIVNGRQRRKRKSAFGRQTESNDEDDDDYGNVSSDKMDYEWIAPIISNAVPVGFNGSTGKSDSTDRKSVV